MWANPVNATFRQNAIDFAEGCGIPELALNLVCPEVRGSGLVAQSPGCCSTRPLLGGTSVLWHHVPPLGSG